MQSKAAAGIASLIIRAALAQGNSSPRIGDTGQRRAFRGQ